MMAKKLGNFTEMVDSKWMEQFISQVLLVLLTETPATISTKTTSPSQGGGEQVRRAKHRNIPVLKMMNALGYLGCNLICNTRYR